MPGYPHHHGPDVICTDTGPGAGTGTVGSENPHAGQGPVVLDVGGDRGALVVLTHPALDGTEIEISRTGRPRTGRHVAVLPRPVGSTTVHAAVFPSLSEGSWRLWSTSDSPVATVDVVGGEITTVRWPEP